MGYADVVIADSPVAYWRLGEGAGTTAFPTVGANNGTYSGVTLAQPGLLPADASPCVYLDGAATISRRRGTVGIRTAPDHRDVDQAGPGRRDRPFRQCAQPDELYPELRRRPVRVVVDFAVHRVQLSQGTRYHVVLVCIIDAGWRRMKLYINGSLFANVTGANSGTTITAWRFGDINQGGAGRYKGWMQDVALYNKELSSARVGVHYAAGTINVLFRQTLQVENAGGVASHKLIPLWADGEKQFHSALSRRRSSFSDGFTMSATSRSTRCSVLGDGV